MSGRNPLTHLRRTTAVALIPSPASRLRLFPARSSRGGAVARSVLSPARSVPNPARSVLNPACSVGKPRRCGFLARLFGRNKPGAFQRLSVWLKDGTELQCRGDAVMDCGDAKFYQLLSDDPCALIAYSGKLLGSGAGDVNIDRMQRHVEGLIRFAAERELPGAPAFLWPEQVAYDENGRFVGYVMPSRPFLRPADFLFDSVQRHKLSPDMNIRRTIELALQLVEMVGVLHGQGIFLGSFQPGSLMIDEKWQLSMVRTDRLCRGVPTAYTAGADLRYLAPELWNAQPEDMARKDLVTADAYTLAVMLFELFTGGIRLQKDTGRWTGQHEFSSIFITEDRAYMRYQNLLLPKKLHEFFYKTFAVHQEDLDRYLAKVLGDRPTVAQWHELLDRWYAAVCRR